MEFASLADRPTASVPLAINSTTLPLRISINLRVSPGNARSQVRFDLPVAKRRPQRFRSPVDEFAGLRSGNRNSVDDASHRPECRQTSRLRSQLQRHLSDDRICWDHDLVILKAGKKVEYPGAARVAVDQRVGEQHTLVQPHSRLRGDDKDAVLVIQVGDNGEQVGGGVEPANRRFDAVA
jgi:hypothetical protein